MSNKLSILYIGNKLAVHGRTPTSIDTLGKLLEQEGHTVYYSSTKLNKMLRLTDMLSSIWRNRKKADVVLIDTYSTSAFYFAWVCSRLCIILSMKYIPILHGGNLPERFKNSPAKCRQLFGSSFMNVTVSAYLQEHLQKAGYRGVTIGNAISIAQYTYRERTKAEPIILWVRAFHNTYNPQMAINVFAAIANEFPQARLIMIGPELDGSMEACKKFAVEQGIENRVLFTGKLTKEEWIDLAKDCDIFINTSNYDNQPVSIIEAMALGLPVVSTNVGGIPYFLEHDKSGLLVEKGNATAMSDAILKLINDDKLVAHLRVNGRKLSEQFDWSNLKHKWEELFNTIH